MKGFCYVKLNPVLQYSRGEVDSQGAMLIYEETRWTCSMRHFVNTLFSRSFTEDVVCEKRKEWLRLRGSGSLSTTLRLKTGETRRLGG